MPPTHQPKRDNVITYFNVYNQRHFIESKIIELDSDRETLYIRSSLYFEGKNPNEWHKVFILLKGSAERIGAMIIRDFVEANQITIRG